MPISLQVRTLFILSLFSYPKMIIGNRPKLREDLSHVGFKSPHDFLDKKTGDKFVIYFLRKRTFFNAMKSITRYIALRGKFRWSSPPK